jgi:hypothetical protein
MPIKHLEYPYAHKGVRKAPDERELRIFTQTSIHEGGMKAMPAPAAKFARAFQASVRRYPEPRELPVWLLALVEKKVSVQELAAAVHDRLVRAPSEENQELALLLANEIARMKGGPEVLSKHATPELFLKLSGKGGEVK